VTEKCQLVGSAAEVFVCALQQAVGLQSEATIMNDPHKRTILFGFLDIHRRLAEMEAMLAGSLVSSPFSQYVNDLSPTERRVIEDYFNRVRSVMLALLQEADIALEVRRTSLRWALQCGITSLSVAVAELGPERLRAYGPLDADSQALARKVQQELTRLIERIAAYLRQGVGRDLAQRLTRLEAEPASLQTLKILERIITRWGLVEFRPQLELIVQRLEVPRFEIAFFGRVNSGKSSLLNHIVGMNILPVGVTPVTAVPIRLARGDRSVAHITFADLPPRSVPVEELSEYASEEKNPGNAKHVTGILVQLPTSRLREGIILVDTPGVGSLARSGSAETLAYLPHCDLGVVLIDAGSMFGPEDVDLLRLLYEAGIPAQVVLSKADLLKPPDRQRMVNYIRGQLRQELGLDLPVHPVSTVGPDEELLTRWFEQEVEPKLAQHRALMEASLRRKINHLRESVIAVLQTMLAQREGETGGASDSAGTGLLRQLLDQTDEVIRQTEIRCRDWTMDVPALLEMVLDEAAQAVVRTRGDSPILDALQRALAQRDRAAQELLSNLRQTLVGTLQGLQQAAPIVAADVSALRDFAFRGLPAYDLVAWRAKLHWSRPWWAFLLPRLAVWSTRRKLERHLGTSLRAAIEFHERQLQAWLKASFEQLVELYEAQAEVFREQARRRRRINGESGEPMTAADLQTLRADLLELEQKTLPQPE
jgi:GTP-binding protein EngB required for normal cell division